MPLMGIREYARHRGVAHRAVQKAIDTGRIQAVLDGKGRPKVDQVMADEAWAINTDETRVTMNAVSSRASSRRLNDGGRPGVPDDDSDEDEGGGLAGVDESAKEYRQHRADRERATAELRQIEVDKLRGRLIEVDEAKRIVYTTFRGLRDAMLTIAPRLKDMCAAETDPQAVELMIENEIMAALGRVNVAALLTEQDEDED